MDCRSDFPIAGAETAVALSVRREVRNLTIMGMDPNQTPKQIELIKDLERSARAEVRLRSMALVRAKSKLRSSDRQSGA
jgi:hypothetical protein